MTAEEQKEWSIKMGMAVLLGKNIYNIGELINKKILKALQGTDFQWLYDILQTMDGGKIAEFERVLHENQEIIHKNALIMNHMNNLVQKVKILAFLELIFHRDKGDRNLSFELVAQATQLQKDEVRASQAHRVTMRFCVDRTARDEGDELRAGKGAD